MNTINFVIFILFIIYIVCTWNSTKEFETPIVRISYMAIGTIFITVLTFFLFQISKIGVEYPKEEIIGEVRKMIMLVFIPINGFIILTQFSVVFSQIKNGILPKEIVEKGIKIRVIILIVLIIAEIIYLKKMQYGIINYINFK